MELDRILCDSGSIKNGAEVLTIRLETAAQPLWSSFQVPTAEIVDVLMRGALKQLSAR